MLKKIGEKQIKQKKDREIFEKEVVTMKLNKVRLNRFQSQINIDSNFSPNTKTQNDHSGSPKQDKPTPAKKSVLNINYQVPNKRRQSEMMYKMPTSIGLKKKQEQLRQSKDKFGELPKANFGIDFMMSPNMAPVEDMIEENDEVDEDFEPSYQTSNDTDSLGKSAIGLITQRSESPRR